MAEISLAKKLIAGGSLGVALFVGGEVMHHQGANKTAATTLEWLGGSAAVLAGIGLGQQGLDILATAEYRRRKEELEALRNKVPLLLPAAASLELAIRKLRNLPEEDAEIFNPNSSSMQPLLAAYHNFPRSSQVAGQDEEALYFGLSLVNERLVDNFVSAMMSRNDKLKAEVTEDCAILDTILPIDPLCPRTPQTEDEGKYWYDWVELQSRPILAERYAPI